jgi:ubiquitin-protein ligase
MDEECFGGTMTRIGAVKQLFHAFANRSMAYNYSHVIGLTLFGSTVKVVSKVSELFESFKKHVDDTLTSGRTALYDALVNASEQLDEFGSKYPDCIKRVLALTDGADNESRNTAVTAAQKLQSSGVRVDSVLVGQGNTVLKAISVASDSMSDGLKLFEMETVLSVQERKLPQVPPLVGSDKELEVYKNLSFYPYDKEPPYHTPDEISQPVTSAKRALHKAAINPPSCGGASAPLKIKRILREIANYQKNPHPAIEIYPCENRLTFWRLLLVGPKGTPYENGVFVLYAKFPDDYPSSPPEIRFVTPIYHCNVNNTGRICHSVFDRNYTTDTSIGIILACMYGLLLEPEPDDPLDSTLAEEYFSQRAVYDYHAREKTSQFAGKSLDERRKELCGGSDLDDTAPYHLKCPLTLELFRDPVLSPSGHTYERRAIEMHLQKTGGSGQDPLTNCDISTQDLVPNRAVKEAVEQYQKQVKQAVEWWQ